MLDCSRRTGWRRNSKRFVAMLPYHLHMRSLKGVPSGSSAAVSAARQALSTPPHCTASHRSPRSFGFIHSKHSIFAKRLYTLVTCGSSPVTDGELPIACCLSPDCHRAAPLASPRRGSQPYPPERAHDQIAQHASQKTGQCAQEGEGDRGG